MGRLHLGAEKVNGDFGGQATAPPSGPRESATTRRQEITISCICLLQGSSDVELMRRISRIGRGRRYLVEDVRSLPQVILQEHGSVRSVGALGA